MAYTRAPSAPENTDSFCIVGSLMFGGVGAILCVYRMLQVVIGLSVYSYSAAAAAAAPDQGQVRNPLHTPLAPGAWTLTLPIFGFCRATTKRRTLRSPADRVARSRRV